MRKAIMYFRKKSVVFFMIVSYFSIIMFCSWSLYIDFHSASLQGEKYSRY